MSRDPSEVPNLPQNAKDVKTYLCAKFGSLSLVSLDIYQINYFNQ